MSDVARLAGVSLKTASRVFNNEKYVSKDKRDRVLAVARELNFQPAVAARGLAGGRSSMIGLFVDEAEGDYISKLTQALANACDAASNHLVVQIIRDPGDRAKIERTIASVRFDGVIIPPPLCDSAQLLDTLVDRGVKVVRLGTSTKHRDIPSVGIDEVAAARAMTSFLVAEGHRNIGFVRGDPAHNSAPAREQGFRDAMRDHGLAIDDRLVLDGRYSFASGREAAKALLAMEDRPTAMFVANDEMAAGMISQLEEGGLRVPDDLSLAGFDNDTLAAMISPSLTTVHQPINAMAEEAHRIINSQFSLENEAQVAENMTFPIEIKHRESVQSR